ncbi:MAG TPA: hypothetical protein PLF56_00470 [Micropruina sp.]|nr:hypothetical protein [Micropruina sp.]
MAVLARGDDDADAPPPVIDGPASADAGGTAAVTFVDVSAVLSAPVAEQAPTSRTTAVTNPARRAGPPTAGRSLATTSTPHPHDATDHQSPTPGYYLL